MFSLRQQRSNNQQATVNDRRCSRQSATSDRRTCSTRPADQLGRPALSCRPMVAHRAGLCVADNTPVCRPPCRQPLAVCPTSHHPSPLACVTRHHQRAAPGTSTSPRAAPAALLTSDREPPAAARPHHMRRQQTGGGRPAASPALVGCAAAARRHCRPAGGGGGGGSAGLKVARAACRAGRHRGRGGLQATAAAPGQIRAPVSVRRNMRALSCWLVQKLTADSGKCR